MKNLILVIVALFVLSFTVSNHAEARCILDMDWPDKPCFDTSPPLPLSKSEWKDLWTGYFDFKGAQWMEEKKVELDQIIKSGNLTSWIESGSTIQNFTNYNVWFYYYVNGKAPAPPGYELAVEPHGDPPIISELTILPKLGETFTLGQDEWAFLKSQNILVKFSNVTEDSRCPTGVVCIWQGRVSVDVNIIQDDKDGGNFVLTLGENENLSSKTFDGYYIRLLKVEPYPSYPNTGIGSPGYQVSLSISKPNEVTPINSPLKQFKSGILAQDIVCKEGLKLIIKSKDNSPACVKTATAPKLVQRGWATSLSSNEPKPTTFGEVTKLSNQFGFEMFTNLVQGKEENIFFSPFSLSNAFSILYEGARGTTQDEIRSTFHFIKDDKMRRDYSHQIITDLNKPSKNYILRSANALWIQDNFPILDGYKNVTGSYYFAKTENLDFVTHTEESRNTINGWVEEKTNNKIKNLLPQGSVNDATRAVITNAVYFLGNWTVQFDEKLTKDDDFKISNQKTVTVSMMNVKQNFNYGSNDEIQLLQMSYKGDDLSMLVLLPKNNDLSSLEKKLNIKNLDGWKSNLEKKEVNVYLPKFKLETTYSLNDNLSKMGMPSVFEPGTADLSGIDGKKDLYVTGVFHKAFVAVDEKGTEAAAATGIVVGVTSVGPQPEIFKADHPFLFLIQDDRTGLILFMGKVMDPTN